MSRTFEKLAAAIAVPTAVALAALGFSGALDSSQVTEVPRGGVAVGDGSKIEEDDPRWDCRYHGNNVCGPLSGHAPGLYFPDADGLRMVAIWHEDVSPAAFWASLDTNGDGHLGDIELGS